MNKTIIKIIVSFLLFILNYYSTSAISYTPSSNAPISWQWIWENAWTIVFPTGWTTVDAHDSANILLHWNFWIKEVSSSSDLTLWWATFDHGVSWSEAKLVNVWWTNYELRGYAWSSAAWWIFFWDTWVSWWKVTYDSVTWLFSWAWWSENLWWMSLEWTFLDITPPNASNFNPIAADSNKTFTVNDNWAWAYDIRVENWNSTADSAYNTKTFNHDFRAAKPFKTDWLYNLSITDPSGNKSVWTIKVVANVPSESLSANKLNSSSKVNEYPNSLSSSGVADWKFKHNVKMLLFDTYWNPVINEPWIKNVTVSLWFNNTVDNNQIENLNVPLGAVSFTWNISTLNWYSTVTESDLLENSLSSIYSIDITSLAPTKIGYSYTTDDNDLTVSKFSYKVDKVWTISWVWETSWEQNKTLKYNYLWNTKFSFTPAVKVASVTTNPAWWNILRDIKTNFDTTIAVDNPSSVNINNIKVSHVLDIDTNLLMSFQDIVWAWSICNWANYPNSNNTNYVYKINPSATPECDKSTTSSSNIYFVNTNSNINSNYVSKFEATPKIVMAWYTDFWIKYFSEIKYKNWISEIAYPSYSYDTSTGEWWVVNNEIKIAWVANKNSNNLTVNSSTTTNIVWTITKNDIKTSIYKNVELLTKTWKSWNPNVLYKTDNDLTLNSWNNQYDTIIVKWKNVIISWDINKVNWKVHWIVALKDSAWNWWNVFVNNNVRVLSAVIFADGWLISWDWINEYYADTQNWAKDQMFIKWTLITNNTIWWSSKATPTCPYWVSPCDAQIAKRYDLNHFRHYVYNATPSIGNALDASYLTKTWYKEAPLIIEYDSDLIGNPPPVFKIDK